MQRSYFNIRLAFFIYLIYLNILTLAPFDFSKTVITGWTFVDWGSSISDFSLNILGFVPFGLILSLLTQQNKEKIYSKYIILVGITTLASLSIEICQIFLPSRTPSLSDVLANTIGGGIGVFVANHLCKRTLISFLKHYRIKLTLAILSLYLGTLIGIFFWTTSSKELTSWDSSYPLLIGNEATLDRPWLGKIFFLALYENALTSEEVKSAFIAGSNFIPDVHSRKAPILLYSFQEGGGEQVNDNSKVKPPYNLEIGDTKKSRWLPKGGLELTGSTFIKNDNVPTKVYQHLTASNTFSISTWIEPKDTRQTGPARIVSFSFNPFLRNFTLGQEGSEIHFRVRNRIAGMNGTEYNLITTGLGLRPQPTHIVAIYDHGTEHLYIDGILFQTKMIRWDHFISWLLKLDMGSYWQKGLLILLLLTPMGGFWMAISMPIRLQ